MMRYVLLAGAILIAGNPALADRVRQVRCAEVAFSQSVENQDPVAFKASIDPDARFIGNSVERGPDEVFAAWAAFFDPEGPKIKWRPQFVEVLADGDLALSRGPYRLSGRGEDGQLVERWGTFNSVWRRTDTGEWLVVFDAGSAPNEDPPAETRALLDAEDKDCELG